MALTPLSLLRPALFLDKDGTLLEDLPYNSDPARMRFAAGAAEAIRRLAPLGVPMVVVSNQSGVAFGRFDLAALEDVRERLCAMFAECGAKLEGFHFCPHHPEGSVAEYAFRCDCRKPAPGLLYRAASEHGIDLQRSWLIGDILDDIEAGKRAGCRGVLLCNGNETEWRSGLFRVPDHLVRDLDEAARLVASAWSGAPSRALA